MLTSNSLVFAREVAAIAGLDGNGGPDLLLGAPDRSLEVLAFVSTGSEQPRAPGPSSEGGGGVYGSLFAYLVCLAGRLVVVCRT